MPQVDETLALSAGAKVFSKLDANSAFWQVPLTETSRHLTTFITTLGDIVSIISIWDIKCPRIFSKADKCHFGRNAWSPVPS